MNEHTAEKDAGRECGWCGESAPIAYTDVLGIAWCETCYRDTFLKNWTPDPAREWDEEADAFFIDKARAATDKGDS